MKKRCFILSAFAVLRRVACGSAASAAQDDRVILSFANGTSSRPRGGW
jgi:hypothetical protein